MAKALDGTDLKLLDLLARDARRPVVALAKELRLSRSATRERLQRLQDSGVIEGYTIRVRWPGESPVEAWLAVKLAAPAKCADVAPSIVRLPGIRVCHAVAGAIDLLVLASATSAEELSALRDAVAAITGIATVTTHMLLAVHKAAAE